MQKYLKILGNLEKESVVAIKGTVQEANQAPTGVEIIPKEINL